MTLRVPSIIIALKKRDNFIAFYPSLAGMHFLAGKVRKMQHFKTNNFSKLLQLKQ